MRLPTPWDSTVGQLANWREGAQRRYADAPLITRWTVAIGAFLVLLVARRPETIFRAEFVFEDGTKWYLDAWRLSLADAITTPYAGYIHLVPRMVGHLERQFPVSFAPLVGNLLALLIVALIAAYVLSDHLRGAVASRTVRLSLALYLILLPGTGMTLGSITFIQFYFAIFLVAVAVSSPPTSRIQAITTYAAGFAAAATGPFGLVVMPLFAGRLILRRDWHSTALATAIGVAAVVQAIMILSVGRPTAAAPTTDPFAILIIVAGHGATTLLGEQLVAQLIENGIPVGVIALVGAELLALAIIQFRRSSRLWLLAAGYVSAAIIGAALIAGSDSTSLLLYPLSATRYFVVPGAVLGASLVVAIATRPQSVSSAVLALIMAVGIVGDLRLSPYPPFDWPVTSSCIGGPVACVVPVYPGGGQWDIRWTGLGIGEP